MRASSTLALADETPVPAEAPVLDIGAGTGRNALALARRGHRVDVINDSYQDFGAGQFIWRAGDPKVEGYVAASDPRRDGQAVGF